MTSFCRDWHFSSCCPSEQIARMKDGGRVTSFVLLLLSNRPLSVTDLSLEHVKPFLESPACISLQLCAKWSQSFLYVGCPAPWCKPFVKELETNYHIIESLCKDTCSVRQRECLWQRPVKLVPCSTQVLQLMQSASIFSEAIFQCNIHLGPQSRFCDNIAATFLCLQRRQETLGRDKLKGRWHLQGCSRYRIWLPSH